MRQSPIQLLTTVSLGCLVLAVGLAGIALSRMRYVPTPAVVVSSQPELRRVGVRLRGSEPGVVLTVKFTQGGGERESSAWVVCGSSEEAEAVAKAQVSGAPVTVFVHPTQPGTFVLDRGMTDRERAALPILIGISALSGAAACLFRPRR